MFTIKQLSTMAGVTTRTLRYYDEIGLLKPGRVGANGYRYYNQASLLLLQQIMFYRELDLPLEDIRNIVGQPGFDLVAALRGHQLALGAQRARLHQLIATVARTIAHLEGGPATQAPALFAGFNEAKQHAYALEAEQRYDRATVRAASQRWDAYDEEKKAAVLAEGDQVYADMIAAMPSGPASAPVQAVVARWRKHVQHFWSPALEQLTGLADTYRDDLRFKANFDRLHPQLADFMGAAVRAYVAAQRLATPTPPP